ncbi:MAG: hypothetical protein LQ352_006866 [Teloschistes flavicans]|nr:MAG: hypothetical protein LQ352_006866 [Teloschistes flavicans]
MRFSSTLAILSLFVAPLSILAAPAPAAAPVAEPEPHFHHHKQGLDGDHGFPSGSFTGSFGARPTDFNGQGRPSGRNGAQATFVPSGRNGGNGAFQTTRVRGGTEATTTADDITGPTSTS